MGSLYSEHTQDGNLRRDFQCNPKCRCKIRHRRVLCRPYSVHMVRDRKDLRISGWEEYLWVRRKAFNKRILLGKRKCKNISRTLYSWTSNQSIASVPCGTNTPRGVANNSAFGQFTAGVDARVFAFVVDTSEVSGTLAVTDAFWSTIWRCANKVLGARTRRILVLHDALWIWTTGRWNTRVTRWFGRRFRWKYVKVLKISHGDVRHILR